MRSIGWPRSSSGRAADVLLTGDPIWIVVAALVLDGAIGDPDLIWRRVPHPVVLFGALIGTLDRRLNQESLPVVRRRLAGMFAIVVVVAVGSLVGGIIEETLRRLPYASLLIALVASVFIAQRGLYEHVKRVRDALETEGLAAGRQ